MPFEQNSFDCSYILEVTDTLDAPVQAVRELEDVQAARCVALQSRPDLIRSATRFHWWPLRIKKRQGPRAS